MGERKVVLDHLPNDIDVHPGEVFHSHCNEVRIVDAEVVEEAPDFEGASKTD